MDKQSTLGMVLIMGLLLLWMQMNQPSKSEMQRQQHLKDSISLVQQRTDSVSNFTTTQPPIANTNTPVAVDTAAYKQYSARFGAFANAAIGQEKLLVLENDNIKVTFSNKGAKIKSVVLKKFTKINENAQHQEVKTIVELLEDSKNKWEYFLPLNGIGTVNSSELYFEPTIGNNSISFKANAGQGRYFEQTYALGADYNVDYKIRFVGLGNVLEPSANQISFQWENYLDKLEKNQEYERTFSTVYFKEDNSSPDYCDCRKDDGKNLETPVKWLSHSNQFFNTTLIADKTPFANANVATEMFTADKGDLKKLYSRIGIPFSHSGDETFEMKIYTGPNEYERLSAYEIDLQDLIPFGWSFFGTINRWIVRPIFNLLLLLFSNKGIVILLLTFIVKAVLFPLTYKMLYSQSKMAALKPRIDKLKEKIGDDQQKVQMETMKMYQEYGVNPLGGCMPMVLQMPIWIALYRFFPASIQFRQESFLWATDLTSYDAFIQLPFEIPLFGSHISLFTMLWVATTLLYTYYSTKQMDFSAQPYMKYMQYIMPVMFMFAFNNYASGLTCYLVFSNILNIGQTLITKNFIINQDKIALELEVAKSKPKKEGFMQKMQKQMENQQKMQQDRSKKK
ncbi:MAG: membrane protein insertase YidC [Saprospiraceae bacterium]